MAITLLLFVPAWFGWRTVFLAGFGVAFATDLVDGYLARMMGSCTHFGMRLDSFADYLLIASAVIWGWMLVPALFTEHAVLWGVIGVVAAVPQVIALCRLGKNAGFHLYSTKASGWLGAAVFVHAVLTGAPNLLLLRCFAVAVVVKAMEETLICLLVPDPYLHPRGSLWAYVPRGAARLRRKLSAFRVQRSAFE